MEYERVHTEVVGGGVSIFLDVAPENDFEPDFDDAETVAQINKAREAGDVWAWCMVRCVAEFRGIEGVDHLGGCSYESKEDFMLEGGYWPDMRQLALEDLRKQLADADVALALEHIDRELKGE